MQRPEKIINCSFCAKRFKSISAGIKSTRIICPHCRKQVLSIGQSQGASIAWTITWSTEGVNKKYIAGPGHTYIGRLLPDDKKTGQFIELRDEPLISKVHCCLFFQTDSCEVENISLAGSEITHSDVNNKTLMQGDKFTFKDSAELTCNNVVFKIEK